MTKLQEELQREEEEFEREEAELQRLEELGNLLKGIDKARSVVQGTWSPLDNSFAYIIFWSIGNFLEIQYKIFV